MKVSAATLAVVLGVKPDRVRQWIRRGHVVRRPDGSYDLTGIEEWITADDTRRHVRLRTVA